MELTWLKKNGDFFMSQRCAMLEPTHVQLNTRRQCGLLSIDRSTLYYCPVGIDSKTLALMRRSNEFYTDCPDLGHRRLVVLLSQEGNIVNVKRVRRLRELTGLEAQFPKPDLSRPGQPRQRFSYLLKGLVISHVHQVWATDITATADHVCFDGEGLLSSTGDFDLRSRYVLHWQLSNTLDAHWCVDALKEALLRRGKPVIFNEEWDTLYCQPLLSEQCFPVSAKWH